MAISSGAGGERRAMSEINVTPLVDVMLVLLIIFMVTTPLIKEGVEIDVPDVRAPAIAAPDDEQLTLYVRKDRSIFIGDVEVALAELEDKLKFNVRIQEKGALYLEADETLPYGYVMAVMATARRAGVRELGMITEPPRGFK